MAENSKIEWTDHTMNFWIGCQEMSPACDFCYARVQNNHWKWVDGWGPHGERRMTGATNWNKPFRWDREAQASGKRTFVFSNSLSDFFDNKIDPEWRRAAWDVILRCQNLTWLILTKRPQNIAAMLPKTWDLKWANVWLGTTVENQEEAERRIPHLLAVPAEKHFLSCEPLLGPIDLRAVAWGHSNALNRVDWIICGGESGPNARPMHPDWARSVRDQCQATGTPYFLKQWGEFGDEDSSRRAEPMALANDGTLYRSVDLAYPDGARYGEAIRANHDKAHLTMMYRIGKAKAGAKLDGREWREFPQG